jgi:hypothetical protein
MLRSVPSGKYCRSNPLVFSLSRAAKGFAGRRVDLDSRIDLETIVLSHFGSLIRG